METPEKTAATSEEKKYSYDSVQLRDILPHRYPFLLIDKVTEMVLNRYVVAIKNVTINEEFFIGHFPFKPVMPGVLILEAMAQAAAVLARCSAAEESAGKTFYLVGADEFKWKRMVVPGDTLRIEMRSFKKRGPLWIMEGEVTVEDKLVASGKLTAVAAD